MDVDTEENTPPTTARQSAFRDSHDAAKDWLDTIVQGNSSAALVALARRCLRIISTLPGDVGMDCFNRNISLSTTLCLEFLGTQWMRDEHVNAGFDLIAQQLGTSSRVFFALCWHLDILHGYRYGHDASRDPLRTYNPARPRYGDKDICLGYVDRVFVPTLVNGNHWTLFVVDTRDCAISYFDPMRIDASPPTEKLSDLCWCLTGLLPGHLWPTVPTPLAAQVQTDTSSCGIVLISAVASLLLGYPQWTQGTWREHRMEWFLRVTQFWHEDNLISIEESADHDDELSPTAEMAPATSNDGGIDFDMDELEAPEDSQEACASWILSCRTRPMQTFSLDGQLAPTSPVVLAADSATPMDLTDYCAVLPSLLEDSDMASDREATPPREKRGASDMLPQAPSKKRARTELGVEKKMRSVRTPEQRLATFRASIRDVDPDAAFLPSSIRAVRCGNCGDVVMAHKDYETGRFRQHRTGCRPRGKNIRQAFKDIPAARILSLPTAKVLQRSVPCPGLTAASDRRIPQHLRHSAMPGGGAPSRSNLANELFDSPFRDLSKVQRRRVRVLETHRYRWLNRHGLQAVFSPICLKTVMVKDNLEPPPCEACSSVLTIKEFRNALARPIPPDEHLKFVPECWREPELGHLYAKFHGLGDLVDKNIMKPAQMLRDFAQGVLSGRYDDDAIFLGAVEAMVTKKSREARGKGMQNMKYPEAFDNACLALRSISGRAYDMFKSVWGGRTPRSIRTVEKKSPRFAPGLSKANVDAAAEILRSYSYTGPVVIACDDTKLEPGLRDYYLAEGAWVVVGQAGDPVHAQDQIAVDALLNNASVVLADKLRAWILIIPVPRIPPIILVTEARGSKDDANTLHELHKRVWDMLRDAHIFPIAYAADGTETERKLQRLITKSATAYDRYTIPNAQRGCEILIEVPLINGHPLIMVQDSKHALKTARNQLFSGARALALGGGAMYYTMLRDIADHQDSPLFRRDVEDVDKQDDRAASRLFAVQTLIMKRRRKLLTMTGLLC